MLVSAGGPLWEKKPTKKQYLTIEPLFLVSWGDGLIELSTVTAQPREVEVDECSSRAQMGPHYITANCYDMNRPRSSVPLLKCIFISI